MLLWFDRLTARGSGAAPVPMGGAVAMSDGPIFQVRAVGSFEQKPGCPDYATSALSPERLRPLCQGECSPRSAQRRPITRIEVVRIRPQSRSGEPIASLIDDP